MEPIGTITIDFPFMDERTRREIETAMVKATDYFDFSNLLSQKASSSYCPPDLVFFAFLHASYLNNRDTIDRIREIHSEDQLIELFFLDSVRENFAIVLEGIEDTIDKNPNYAIMFYLLMKLLRESDPGSREETKVQTMIEDLLKRNELLWPHSAEYYSHLGQRHRWEGNPKSALELYQKALEISVEFDDQLVQSRIYHLKAELLTLFNADESDSYTKAKNYLNSAMAIMKSLSDKSGLAMVLQNISVISGGRGEFTEAIESQFEAIQLSQSIGESIGTAAYNLSMYYSFVGDGKNAHEWAKVTFEEGWAKNKLQAPYAHAAMTSAYLLLNKTSEARTHLDKVRQDAIESGLEMSLGMWYALSGEFERRGGDLDSAIDSYSRALEINVRNKRQNRARTCISSLTSIELEMFNPTIKNRDDENSGPWMTKFERMIQGYDVPGFEAELLLLKAELRMKQGRHDEGETLLETALELTDHSSTRHLHEQASRTRDDWISDGILHASESSAVHRKK